jgi:hypothetical protein
MPPVFHVSEEPNIEVFVPRLPSTPTVEMGFPVVWAVDAKHLVNYLVPRECPRVAFHTLPGSSEADRAALLGRGGAEHVVAIDATWFERAVNNALWVYEFAPEAFACIDATAGYFVSRVAITPTARRHCRDPLAELVAAGVELRVVSNLQALAQAVASSSLAFSCIRMRNLTARQNAF